MNRPFLCALLSALLVSTSYASVVFNQAHNGGGTLHKSSWYPPDGLDGDVYCWDNFTLASNTAISEIHWRGGYEYHPAGTGQAPVFEFEVAIYRSIATGTQPDVGAGGRLVRYFVGGNAGETPAGVFGGVALYDYVFVLPSPFQAAAATPYWVQIVASQGVASPSFAPDWGLAVGTGGNNYHFRKITGGNYQAPPQDLAFALSASDAPAVTITAGEFPSGTGAVTGAGSYPVGSTVSLSATPNAGWGFVNWTEGGIPVRDRPDYAFTASVDRTLVAQFVPSFTITTAVSPVYAGTVTGGGTYNSGANVTLVANPNHGFVFTGWSDGSVPATNSFAADADVQITAFFASAPHAATFDFDSGPVHTSLPLDLTAGGMTAHFSGGYSIQPAGTLGLTPAGFSGLCLYPNSVFASDLLIGFPVTLIDFSILYAVDELGCDTSATMRVTAYRNGLAVGTNTTVAPVPGSYPTGTLSIAVPGGFDSVVVHWQSPGAGCQDYGPIFLADNVTVTRATTAGVDDDAGRESPRILALSPNPFQHFTTIHFDLPQAGDVRMQVYDIAGRRVRTLASASMPAGNRSVTWDGVDGAGRRVSAGVYFLRLETHGGRQDRRMLVLK